MKNSCVPLVASGRAERVSIRGHLCDAVGKGEKTYLNVDF